MKIIQLLTHLNWGDAISNDVLAIDDTLRAAGYESEIMALKINERLKSRAKAVDFSSLRPEDILLFHKASGDELMRHVVRLPCRKGMIYHNITPARFFLPYDAVMAWHLNRGRRQLRKYAAGMDWYRQEIRKCTYRDFTTGFYFGRPDTQSMVYTDNTYASDAVFLGIVEESTGRTPTLTETGEKREPGHGDSIDNGDRVGGRSALPHLVSIRQKNKFSVGETIEIMCPDGRDLQTRVLGMWNEDGEPVQSAPHPGELIRLQLDEQASPGDILRISR